MYISKYSLYASLLLNNFNNPRNNQRSTIDKNSKQYQALVKDGTIAGIDQAYMMMSPEEKVAYNMMNSRETIIKNHMKRYDKDGDLINGHGVAGMDITGKGNSWKKLTDVSEENRQIMFDQVKRDHLWHNGLLEGRERHIAYRNCQLSVPKKDRLPVTYTLSEYERQYEIAFDDAVKAMQPGWKEGMPYDRNIVRKITRQDVEKMLTKQGNRIVRKRIDITA